MLKTQAQMKLRLNMIQSKELKLMNILELPYHIFLLQVIVVVKISSPITPIQWHEQQSKTLFKKRITSMGILFSLGVLLQNQKLHMSDFTLINLKNKKQTMTLTNQTILIMTEQFANKSMDLSNFIVEKEQTRFQEPLYVEDLLGT